MTTSSTSALTRWSWSTWSRTPTRPKVLAIGPDRSGRLLEVIRLDLADDRQLVIHAMDLRPIFYDLLPPGGDTHD